MDKFKGLMVALVAPYENDGTLNYDVLKQIIDDTLAKGAKGFYVGGTTQEAFLQSLDERKEILEMVVKANNSRGTVIAHVGTIATHHAVELALHAQDLGVDAISALPPFYYKFTKDEIKDYYREIVESTNIPMFVYNFPGYSGVEFGTDSILELLELPNVIGMKHTSQNLFQLESIKARKPETIILCGHDEIVLPALTMGASGAVGCTYNFMIETFNEIINCYSNGDLDKGRKLQSRANELITAMLDYGVIPSVKAILNEKGYDVGVARKPFKEVNKEGEKHLMSIINKNNLR